MDRNKLIRIHRLLKGIVQEERHLPGSRMFSMLARCSGILGSWNQLKSETTARFIRDLTREVSYHMRHRDTKAHRGVRAPSHRGYGRLAGTNGNTETVHWRGLPPGMERHGTGLRPETFDIHIDEVLSADQHGCTIVVEDRIMWIAQRDIYEIPGGQLYKPFTGEATVSLAWAKRHRLRGAL